MTLLSSTRSECCPLPQKATALKPEQLAKLFKALGHPTRLRIVEHLLAIDTCVCGDIVDIFPFSQSTISQHLKQLKESGIVCGEVEGPKTYFCVDKTVLSGLKAYMDQLCRQDTCHDNP